MTMTKESILAGSFFDLADNVQDIADSDIAQQVETFTDEDYGVVVSLLLDAGYWILAGQLDETLEDDPMGHALYVATNVYNDLLYRGYGPAWSWQESGMADLFETTPVGAPDIIPDSLPARPQRAASEVESPYVMYPHGDGLRGGVVAGGRLIAFDGAIELVPEKFRRISEEQAFEYMAKNSDAITASRLRRDDKRRAIRE